MSLVSSAAPQQRPYDGPTSVGTAPEPAAPIAPEPAVAAPVAEPPKAPPPAVDDLAPGYDPTRDSPEALRARHWLRGGIVATSAGFVLTLGGILMATIVPKACEPDNPDLDPSGNSCQEGARERAALTLAVPGALMITGGVAMLAVGGERLRRLRAGVRASAQGGALVVSGRF